ncbi:DUF3280 domain-containing protein [Ancylobacter terrae]|uniref:DUF3280 domain-containing protein n=1 Tax=Ancylobacter sp. sgz301288 TaxID=3342077 RepID=UPI00385D646E
MGLFKAAAIGLLAFAALSSGAQAATRVAVFEFELFDTSGQQVTPTMRAAEDTRLALITQEVRRLLAQAGYTVVDLAPEEKRIMENAPFRNCNSCELPIAQALGADIEVIGLVQKVSDLILNINFQLRDVATGAVLRAGSADIRSNSDESWMRGTSYLVRNRLLDPPLTGKAAP